MCWDYIIRISQEWSLRNRAVWNGGSQALSGSAPVQSQLFDLNFGQNNELQTMRSPKCFSLRPCESGKLTSCNVHKQSVWVAMSHLRPILWSWLLVKIFSGLTVMNSFMDFLGFSLREDLFFSERNPGNTKPCLAGRSFSSLRILFGKQDVVLVLRCGYGILVTPATLCGHMWSRRFLQWTSRTLAFSATPWLPNKPMWLPIGYMERNSSLRLTRKSRKLRIN